MKIFSLYITLLLCLMTAHTLRAQDEDSSQQVPEVEVEELLDSIPPEETDSYSSYANPGAPLNGRPHDSVSRTAGSFARSRLDSLKKLPDYQYEVEKTQNQENKLSILERFLSRIDELIRNILDSEEKKSTAKGFFYLLSGLVLAYAVLRLIGVKTNFFYKRSKSDSESLLAEEDIHGLNFDREIKAALALGNYRLAVRLLYLQTLKKLSDAQLIQWEADKTNADYVRELRGSALQKDFDRLTYFFEYVWYGNFDIRQDAFERAQQLFISFGEKMNSKPSKAF